MTRRLNENEYLSTMTSKMADVTDVAVDDVIDIWVYVEDLVYENIVSDYVLQNNLVEKVYRNDRSSYDHILLPTSQNNNFIVIVVNLIGRNVYGHYHLNLEREYGVN